MILNAPNAEFISGHINAADYFNPTTEDRELVVLIGPSGCGKTTTTMMIQARIGESIVTAQTHDARNQNKHIRAISRISGRTSQG